MDNIVYIWRAYYSPEDFDKQNYFSQQVFSDFEEMKSFSANHSYTFKEIHPQYCSQYWKFILL